MVEFYKICIGVAFIVSLLIFALIIRFIVINIIESYNENDFYISMSKIHGEGVFTKIFIKKDDKLFQVLEGRRVIGLSKKINHCPVEKSNTYVKQDENNIWFLYALRDINKDEEIVCDYNNTPRHLIKGPEPGWTC